MKILIACEESQVVCKAFRERGHEAYSCDIQDCSGGRPDWHLQTDVLNVLNGNWDLVIAFPPCTDLAVSGARYFQQKRQDGRQPKSIEFFMAFANYEGRIAIENPVGIMSRIYRKPDQIIQPWQFGHPESKATCLWLKGLPLLTPTKYADFKYYRCPSCHNVFEESLGKYGCWCEGRAAVPLWENQTKSGQNKLPPRADRGKMRSKTYEGIAEAMAEQWG